MKKSSFKEQVAIACILFTVILTFAIGLSGYLQYRKSIMQKYYEYADTVVNLAESSFVENGMYELIEKRTMGANYDKTRQYLNNLKENADVAYVYAVFYTDIDDPNSLCFVINGATAEDLYGVDESEVYSYMAEEISSDGFEPDVMESYYKVFREKDTSFHYHENVTPEYGHMLSVYKLLLNEENEPMCLLNVDLDVNDIEKTMNNYVIRMISIAVILMIALLFIFIEFVDRYITTPVMGIADSTGEFVEQLRNNAAPEELAFRDIKINLGNDIGQLYGDVREMANSIKDYMINLRTVTKESERIGTELQVATNIQMNLLPTIFPPFPLRKEFDVYGYMHPAKEVGGDFYDFFFVDDDHFAMVIADVSGKGVPAALFMVIAKTLINNQVQMTGNDDLGGSLAAVSDKLCENNGEEMFVTVWLAVVDLRTGDGVAVNAGHEYPALRRANGNYELVKYPHAPAVAVMEGLRFKSHTFHLDPGDSLYVYTDGVTEATNAHYELFGEARLVESLNKNPDASLEELFDNVIGDINDFVGDAPQFDDMTMLGFTYNGK